jgi:hypothetical protein
VPSLNWVVSAFVKSAISSETCIGVIMTDKPHFLAWLLQKSRDIASKGEELPPICFQALTDSFFPPLNPREHQSLFWAHFWNKRLKPENFENLWESFKDARDEYDPPLIKSPRIS